MQHVKIEQRLSQPNPYGQGMPPSPDTTPGPAGHPSCEDIERARQDSQLLAEQVVPVHLRTLLGVKFSQLVVQQYIATLTAGITDPIEKMVVEQFAIAHHRLLNLHVIASDAQGLEAIKVYNQAAVRLQGELRRCALALKAYRQPPTQKSFSVVHQQNVVAGGGDQSVLYVEKGKGKESLVAHDELNNTPSKLEDRIHGTFPRSGGKPTASDRIHAPKEAATVDG